MKLDSQELEMARMLVSSMTKPFEPAAYRDEYQARLRDAISKKIRGQEVVVADTGAPDNVIDLMEALQRSLEQAGADGGRRKAGA